MQPTEPEHSKKKQWLWFIGLWVLGVLSITLIAGIFLLCPVCLSVNILLMRLTYKAVLRPPYMIDRLFALSSDLNPTHVKRKCYLA